MQIGRREYVDISSFNYEILAEITDIYVISVILNFILFLGSAAFEVSVKEFYVLCVWYLIVYLCNGLVYVYAGWLSTSLACENTHLKDLKNKYSL